MSSGTDFVRKVAVLQHALGAHDGGNKHARGVLADLKRDLRSLTPEQVERTLDYVIADLAVADRRAHEPPAYLGDAR